ncbi:MAG: S1 RNA-binding domain-containing protein [Flavonifractor plautii]
MVTLRSRFLPEGRLLHTPENEAACASRDGLRRAMEEETVLEGVAQLCDGAHNLLVSVGPFTGFLPGGGRAGHCRGTTREIAILSRVGKPVCFQITALEESEGVLRPRLSRRRAQQAALDAMLAGLHPGCILPAVVTHLESFGAFVDIGCGVPSLIGIENISVSRIPHPDQRFRVGQAIFAVVQELDPKLGRVYLTHRELLGTWAENAARFQAGMTVPGIVRGLKE